MPRPPVSKGASQRGVSFALSGRTLVAEGEQREISQAPDGGADHHLSMTAEYPPTSQAGITTGR
jgi:hypothetical protein